ncbi:hypothetical protein AMCSP12_000194 [Streptococcus pneumoniae 2070108]|nr:hypothetical protein AMCSP12_000194 [Streptococcus pneumoniae 2070108]EJG51788.1 hypothetical protein AMCSP06_000277 [Streptococcus pneumoniae 2070768]HEU6189511.1 hypothetical protein [Streptococcus pneumoniae]HEU6205994.1 hypothetical protein [Streptococcus pneumoniae]
MKLRIFAEDKPAKKVFEYQLELADRTILLSTALLSGAIALAGIFSALKENKNRKEKTEWFYQILKKI